MAFTYLRHQLHLHRYKIVAFFLVALLSGSHDLLAQGKLKGENLPGYEFKRLRWGFSLGVNGSWYQLEHSQYYVDRNDPNADPDNDPSTPNDLYSPYSVNEKTGIGFNVNFITTYRLSPNFVLRAQPGVGYHSRIVEYKGKFEGVPEEGFVEQKINTFSGEFPLLVKYEAKRRKNTQMYFVAGVKPSIIVGGLKKDDPEVLQVKNFDFTIEYGVGLDMFYPFFKFSPEIRYSRGISNIHQPYFKEETPRVYNNSIQQLNTNTITLYLNFE